MHTVGGVVSRRRPDHADRAGGRCADGRGEGLAAGHRPAAARPAGWLRFSAFNQRTTPEINGAISRISADVSADQRSGQSFYTIRIAIPAEEIARLGNVKLVPGMPVEAFMKTDDRTVMSYFVKPLEDQVLRAFRER